MDDGISAVASDQAELAELLRGLQQTPKRVSPKYFYDERGSQLFTEITEQPEYYPTRTELGIMQDNTDAICQQVGAGASLIEFGAGSGMKTRLLLEHLPELAVYVPVDISRQYLLDSAAAIGKDFPDIEVLPVVADFTKPFDLPTPKVMPRKNIVYFPGSTIGNFTPDEAIQLLKVMRHEARDDGALLIGVDLKKERSLLERAYNDSAGVTAAFNLNLLTHLNRRFDADFDKNAFMHRAVYNDRKGRVEMYLISRKKQTVTLAGHELQFDAAEALITEYSHKWSLKEFAETLQSVGFAAPTVWTDAQRLFSLQYAEAV